PSRMPRRPRDYRKARRRDRELGTAHGRRTTVAAGRGRPPALTWSKDMSARKRLRAIMAGKRLVLMPGAYDALSARIIESEGFEALVAGGYAGIGSMLAQADM